MALSYGIERLTDLWDEVRPLAEAHLAEVSELARHGLDLDRDCYARLEAAGGHLFVTARAGEMGRLVGYLSLYVKRAPHAKVKAAWQDAIYLAPEHRAGWNAQGLIAAADTALRDAGVAIVYQLVPTTHDFGPVLRQLGYNPTEIVWTRHLAHPHAQAQEASHV